MKPLFLASFFLLSGNAFADEIILKEIKGSSKRYLEYTIPKNESEGIYKIWNLTQNKQVGEDIKKSNDDESDIVSLDGNPGDKFTLLNSSGSVVASYTDNSEGASSAAASSQKKKLMAKDTAKAVSVRAGEGSSDADQVGYIRVLKTSHQDVVAKLRFQLKNTREKLSALLKKKSAQDITNTCSTTKMGGLNNKTLAITANCQEDNQLSKAEVLATSNLEKVEKYEKQVMNDLGISNTAVATPSVAQTLTRAAVPMGCAKTTPKDYVHFRLFSSWMNPGKGLEDLIDVPNPGAYSPNSDLVSRKEIDTTSEAYRNDKATFLDRCRPQLPETWSNFSNARSGYKKIYGVRRLSLWCDNGVRKPDPLSVISTFSHEGDHLVACPKYEEEACWPPSWKFEKYYKGEVFTKDMYAMRDQASGLPVKVTGSPHDDIVAMGVYSNVYCKVGEKIYSVQRSPLYECVPGEKAKYVGMGNDAVSDYSANITPGGAGAHENVLSQYKACSEYGIDVTKGFSLDKEKRLDGLYAADGSTEEFKVEEEIGTGKISVDSTYRGAQYKGLARKDSNGSYVGKAVDYPGACLEIVPSILSIDRLSSNEIKLTHTILENSCTFKAGETYSFTLKRK